jgi:putative addiction module component (TIGR02574 family)
MECVMTAMLKEIEAQALSLSPQERGELIHRLIVSLDDPLEDTPEAVARAWDEEIARRVAEIDAGTAVLVPHEQVVAEIDEMLRKSGN